MELQPRQLVCPPIAIASVNFGPSAMPKVIFSECEPGCDCMDANSGGNTLEDLFGSEPSDDKEESSEEADAP